MNNNTQIETVEDAVEKEYPLLNVADASNIDWVQRLGKREGFLKGANEMLPIIKELGEALIKANLYVPPKFYGQGESVDNDHYLEIQTTLDKYKNYL
jgi:hypothetical protein